MSPQRLPIQIYGVRSRKTGRDYHLAIASADVDYVTDGLILLASTDKEEIILLYASNDEYRLGPDKGSVLRAERENQRGNRKDLVGIVFDENMPSIKPELLDVAFRDIHDSRDHADAIAEVSQSKYRKSGGVLVDKR